MPHACNTCVTHVLCVLKLYMKRVDTCEHAWTCYVVYTHVGMLIFECVVGILVYIHMNVCT